MTFPSRYCNCRNRNRLCVFLYCLIGAAFCAQVAGVHAQTVTTIESDWRITRVEIAPWAPAELPRTTLRAWVGQPVNFHNDSVNGTSLLQCGHAVLEPTIYPAEGLFQGNLPAPAAAAAHALGIAHLPLAGVRLSCDSGMFEFHRVAADTLLLGLDNQVLTLSHTPGTQALADVPEGRVQRFLEMHFSGDMGFSAAGVKAGRSWFSKRVEQAAAKYFARPAQKDAVPVIDGDPFTDSQEYPTRFAVGKARVSKGVANVPVRFSDAFHDNIVMYRLRREGGAWRIVDLRNQDGTTLLGLLN